MMELLRYMIVTINLEIVSLNKDKRIYDYKRNKIEMHPVSRTPKKGSQ